MIDAKKIKQLVKESISNYDMHEFVPYTKGKIIEYNELEKLNDIEELLTHDGDFRVILIEYTDNDGHWILVSRYGDTIELFNSYGVKHSKKDFMDNATINKYLGQSKLHLKRLLDIERKDMKFKVIYNKKKLQIESDNINTCGRHVLTRLVAMKDGLNLQQYHDFMKKAKTHYKLNNYDELVSVLVH